METGFFAKRRAAREKRIRAMMDEALLAAEARRAEDAARDLKISENVASKLDKIARRQDKTELLCEDIQETLGDLNAKASPEAGSVPDGLFCETLEAFDLLRRFCDRSTDSELAAHSPRLGEKMNETLARYGVVRIDQTGVPVDSRLHKVYSVEPPLDERSSGTVKRIIVAGCVQGERVIRRALIIAYGSWSS